MLCSWIAAGLPTTDHGLHLTTQETPSSQSDGGNIRRGYKPRTKPIPSLTLTWTRVCAKVPWHRKHHLVVNLGQGRYKGRKYAQEDETPWEAMLKILRPRSKRTPKNSNEAFNRMRDFAASDGGGAGDEEDREMMA